MATKNKKNNLGPIVGVCIAVIVIIAIIIAVVVANNQGINDSYFVSDGSKYVLTIATEETESDDEAAPIKVHSVYNYSGDTITALKTYYQFKDAATAKAALETIPETEKNSFKEVYLDGKYIVFVSKEEDYANTKASEVKENIDFINSHKDIDPNNAEYIKSNDGEEIDEGGTTDEPAPVEDSEPRE